MSNTIEKVQNALNEFYKIFRDNPFDYLYEFEINSDLYSILKRHFQNEVFNPKLPDNKVNFSIVRGQYHPLSSYKLDIVVLQNQEIEKRKDLHTRAEDINEMYHYWQKINIGIELKFQPVGTDQTREFKSDVERLLKLKNDISHPEENSITTGIAILFFQRSKFLENILGKKFSKYVQTSNFEIKPSVINAYLVTPERMFYKIFK